MDAIDLTLLDFLRSENRNPPLHTQSRRGEAARTDGARSSSVPSQLDGKAAN
jgi:hypothetical protein